MVISVRLVVFVIGFWSLTFCGAGFSQQLFPADGEVFRDDVVPVIRITIDPDSLQAIYANPYSDHEYPAGFEFDNGLVNEVVSLVGFRCRGNTSRFSKKKSFKVAFNSFDGDQKFYGLEKMNLNGEHNDPSVIRSKLGWDICKDLNIPASRANHILLYINDEFWGVYINVEHVDEEFVNLRYGNKDGNLYKCLWPAALNWLGNDPESYKFMNDDRRAYQLKTNEEADDYTDLMDFIRVLNNTPINLLYQELPKVFNVDSYLSAMVMDIFTGNWDGPIFNKNNFYLYNNTESGLFEYIPYDLDNTFGIDWFGIDWDERDIYNWCSPWEARPIYERILAVPQFREMYSELFREFLENHILNGELEADIIGFRSRIASRIPDDPFYSLDYGWDFSDFLQSYNDRLDAGHVKSGLIPYIQNRTISAINQLDVLRILSYDIDEESTVYPNPASDYITFQHSAVQTAELFSLAGSDIAKWDLLGSRNTVSLSGIVPGTYILKQQLANGRTISQLLIII
ncbi:MAG: CotH kinase family protein [Bacteroidales bacterium]|nr:CotH kinase family protein [Bacteroidales bacterium]